eukprot:CAMPEP_0183592118 /NCGR_PEP_ID=MMETSP0371-20130417/167443_1 /TAXON_ID=268820 /ORGANISM="Peridinium aciculiferum, Strain PAER-2" /LENGTH=74 /DNA_ID=CAMNT_0025803621 /DNA_START=192 /DNA_END=413 /DNA_ORIENTATION=-
MLTKRRLGVQGAGLSGDWHMRRTFEAKSWRKAPRCSTVMPRNISEHFSWFVLESNSVTVFMAMSPRWRSNPILA